MRNEILWGLIPKTLSGLWLKSTSAIETSFGVNPISHWQAKTENERFTQQHDVQIAMKTLQHEGFLRGPGLLQLETIQKYFEIINEEPKFRAQKKNVTDFCTEGKAT